LSEVVEVETLDELNTIIIGSGQPVVVDFAAPAWCIPCQRFAPHYEKAAEAVDGVTFVHVDIDKVPDAAVEYAVQGVPTVVLFENGERKRDLKERTAIKFINEINS